MFKLINCTGSYAHVKELKNQRKKLRLSHNIFFFLLLYRKTSFHDEVGRSLRLFCFVVAQTLALLLPWSALQGEHQLEIRLTVSPYLAFCMILCTF